MAYRSPGQPNPLPAAPRNDPLTLEDILARQERLQSLGLGDSLLGDLNQKSLDALNARSGLKAAARESVLQGALGAAM